MVRLADSDLELMFTTREVAIAVWICLLVGWALSKSQVRASFGNAVRSALHWKIVLPVALMAAYTAIVVGALFAAGVWTPNLVKDTVFWFVLSLATAFSTVLAEGDGSIWRRIMGEQLRVVVILEYVVNTYTFAFPVEFVLVPVVAMLAMLDVVARSDATHAQVAKLTGGLQALLGFAVLAFAVGQAVNHFEAAQAADAFRSLLLAPILSVSFVPFIYLLIVVTSYESLFVRLKLGPPKNPGAAWYARRRLVCHLGLRPHRVRTFMCRHAWDLTRIRSKADVDALLTLEREG